MSIEYLDKLYRRLRENGELDNNIPMKEFFEEYRKKRHSHSFQGFAESNTEIIIELNNDGAFDPKSIFNINEDTLYATIREASSSRLNLITKCKNLQFLRLVETNFQDFSIIKKFNHLKFLVIDIILERVNSIDLSEFENLLWVDLSAINVENDLKINQLPNLQTIKIDNSRIRNIEISELPDLLNLDISQRNDIETLVIKSLPKKEKIDISKNKRVKFVQIVNCENLKSLLITKSKLQSIDLEDVNQLENLELNDNILQEVNLKPLNSLVKLNLRRNQIRTIDFANLINLRLLYLDYNQLEDINLKGLANLEELELNDNSLIIVNLENLQNLKIVNLMTNMIKFVKLYQLPNLYELYLSDNELINLDFSELPNLHELYLSDNELRSIDLSINHLPKLKNLSLSSNNLQEIPENLSDFETTLKEFSINNNPLHEKYGDFANWNLVKQMRFLNQQRGYGYFYAHWDMPEEVAILFSTYLGRFKNIVREKTGKEIHFEIQTEANGLRLVTKAGKDFSLEEINGMLFYYMAKLANQSSLESQKLEDEIRNLKFRLERTEFENKELNIEISLFKKENIDLRGEKDDLQGKLISLHEQTLSFVMKIQQPQNKHDSVTFSIPQFTEILATLKPSTTMIDISPEFKNIGNPQVTNTNTNTNTNSLSSSQAFSVEAFRKEITPFISRLNVIKEDLEEQDKTNEIKPLLEDIIKLLKAAENVAKEEDKEKIKSSSFWTRLGSFYQKTKTEVIGLSKYLTPDNIKKFQENAKLLGKMTGYEFEGAE